MTKFAVFSPALAQTIKAQTGAKTTYRTTGQPQKRIAATELFTYKLLEDMGTITTSFPGSGTYYGAHADVTPIGTSAGKRENVELYDTIGLASWQVYDSFSSRQQGICCLGKDGNYWVIVPECEPDDTGSGGP